MSSFHFPHPNELLGSETSSSALPLSSFFTTLPLWIFQTFSNVFIDATTPADRLLTAGRDHRQCFFWVVFSKIFSDVFIVATTPADLTDLFSPTSRSTMVTDNLDDLLHIDVPMFATMAVISVMMSNREQRQALPREPYKELVDDDDHATGDHVRSIFDQFGGTNPDDDCAPPTNEPKDCESFEVNSRRHETPRSSGTKTGRTTRTVGENTAMDNVGDKLGELAASIDRARKKTWKEKLSDALWDMEGYDDGDMEMVFDRLMTNKKQAELFYLRKPSLRKRWLDNFIESIKNSNS
ncbi:uncharacterized protein LOC120282353 isoform X2 [Dioscorea cayenensis subsp. rotundata]|uniref:Uncharacterized protein LOC120282353 isoform X2 n=1 Tax=Dioscorea cayennensis subsp. rotundata TaxID=55577 RepID=A0AB40CYK4_DIOCR|nr:uncharacterized protein LOC120282353 isoform X2 [Dioscorea cayenensis subsp. rotundata]